MAEMTAEELYRLLYESTPEEDEAYRRSLLERDGAPVVNPEPPTITLSCGVEISRTWREEDEFATRIHGRKV